MAKDQVDPAQPFREAMQLLIASRFGDVWKAVPVAIEGSDPEGVHKVRVASRRLRAAMDVAADAFPASWYRPLQRAAKEITGALGRVRDRDVQLEYLEKARASAPPGDRVGIERLIGRLTHERDAARVKMLTFLEEIESRDVAGEAERRFGAAAGFHPPVEDR